MNIMVVSGGFDPLHKGHLEYIHKAKEFIGEEGKLIAIVNRDVFLIKKKGYFLLDEETRLAVVSSLRDVDEAVLAVDEDLSVMETLRSIILAHPSDKIYFGKGGDRNKGNIPETELCAYFNVQIIDTFGEKIDSSSSIVDRVRRKQ